MRKMSNLSLSEWNHLREQSLAPAEAVAYLYADLPSRSFAETLTRLHPGAGLRERLTAILAQSGVAAESADRTVRNWLAGKSVPAERETLFRVAFGLQLSVADANRLLCAASDYGIHARDPEEVVYLFALLTGQSFADAQALKAQCATLRGTGAPSDLSTQLLGGQVATLRDNAEFVQWYAAHAEDFSQLHNAAYEAFMECLHTLLGDGEDFSLEYIASTCLRFRNAMPLDRSVSQLDGMQRLLKHYWPSTTTIKQMKNRRIDVSRKALLLLFILCEGETDINEYSALDEPYITPAERLEAHAFTADEMLARCGMGTLDPRGPFDWLVMYCMCHDVDEGMSERMEQIIRCFFGSETESTLV